jgi:hypothetical protein
MEKTCPSLSRQGGHMTSMTQSTVTIQVTPISVPSTPSWLGEVAAFAQVLSHLGLLKAIQERVRFARARFGTYDTIDFVVVLIGYALSGEPSLKAFYERLAPFAEVFMALFGRHGLPKRSTLSRFLAALDQAAVEALRTLFLADLAARQPFTTPGSLSDRQGICWWVIDVDGTKQAARQRALPHHKDLPAPHRRMNQVCAPGYLGRQRGEVARTRTTVLQAFTHQWIGTYSGSGNGDYRGELKRALEAITWYALTHQLPLAQMLIRLDGLYGNAAPLMQVLSTGMGVIGRSKDYGMLGRDAVRARLTNPPDEEYRHPESGTSRSLYDCPDLALTEGGPLVRVIVATHPATSAKPPIGVQRDGTVYELFVTRLPEQAFTPQDVLDLYLHRGSFEIVLADEDSEQDTDRWCSHTPAGQEFWQIVNQWVWNLRLELGHALHPTSMRTTEFAPVREPAPAADPERTLEKDSTPKGFSPRDYGPPQWARRSFTGGFPGSAFLLQADGTLLCPARHRLYPQERRPERDGSYRVLYAARIGDCRACELRVQCQESVSTVKPRRVSAVFWPRLTIPSEVATLPVLGPPQPLPSPSLPVLWRDWPRRSIRRNWLKVLRSETVAVSLDASPTSPSETREPVFTRAERAHWRMTWPQRLARNARSSTASSLTLLLHGLSATFAHRYGFAFLDAT